MVQLPGIRRPDASDVIAKLIEMSPNLRNEKIPIPNIPDKEDPNVFRLYGKETSEEFTGIPATKNMKMLTLLDLNFVTVDAGKLISCLKECENLTTIEMIVINEGDRLFEKISLPKLRKFYYRQLNVTTQNYPYIPYITNERMESLLFFGPLEQLWENKMSVKVVVKSLTILQIQYDEDEQCSVHLTATEGTVNLYDNMRKFKNLAHVYLLDHRAESGIYLELKKFPEMCLKTLAVNLQNWNDTVNEDITRFQSLKELYLSIGRDRAGIISRPVVLLSCLPSTLIILSLRDVLVAIQTDEGIECHLQFESLSFIDCSFCDDFTLEKMDPANFNVKKVFFIINRMEHKKKKIYRPTWELLDFLISHEVCKSFYFGSFEWSHEYASKDELLPHLEHAGVLINTPSFSFEHNGEWRGKAVGISEHFKILNERTYINRFMMTEKDDFQEIERNDELISIGHATSQIANFQTYKHNEPAFVIDGSNGTNEYLQFEGLQNKATIKRINLKRVAINASSFVLNFRGCKELVTLSMENVKVAQKFFSCVDLPNIKEFFFVLDEHLTQKDIKKNFFDIGRMKSTLFFNKNTFKGLWTRAINVLIAVDNARVLEFNHEKELVWLQNCDYASDIIKDSGLLEESAEEIKIFIIHDCTGLTGITNLQSSTHLTYLHLTKVDINFSDLLKLGSFPRLQFLYLEANDKSTELDLYAIPKSVHTVGLASMSLTISNEVEFDCLTIKNCYLPEDFEDNQLPFLKVRRIGLIGPALIAKHGKILEKLFVDEKICKEIYIKNAAPEWLRYRAKELYGLLMSLNLNREGFTGFEVSRHRSKQWSLHVHDIKSKEEHILLGADIIYNQQHPTV